jgi:glycosyltransferase involved in cell wall biosynthesis
VLNQTFRAYELIVVDDGSTDKTFQELHCFGIDFESNGRQIRQSLPATQASRVPGGDFPAVLDSDDIWQPEKLARQVRAAEANPQSGLVAVDGVQFSGGSVLHESLYPPEFRSPATNRSFVGTSSPPPREYGFRARCWMSLDRPTAACP